MARKERLPRQEWEARYVSDYVARRYPGVPVRIHARLGTPPRTPEGEPLESAEERMLRVYMRWADAIVFRPEETVIIEGKLNTQMYLMGIAQLELYLSLLPHTGEYAHLLADKVTGELLIPSEDPTIESLARRKGLRVVIWAPSWLSEYLDSIPARYTRPVRPEEAELL
jgi:hypothetical protein